MSERDLGFDHLVYVRIFEGCNLHCDHCFIPANPKKISLEQAKEIVVLLKNNIPAGKTILLQWHGGEPTIFGPDVLEKYIVACEEANNGFYILKHGIQTNLLNYQDKDFRKKFVRIYNQYFDKQVGVSYDPLIRKVVSGDQLSANERFEDIYWENLKALVNDGLEPYMVITATKTMFNYYKNPVVLFDKLTAVGIKKLHLERVTKVGMARENWDELGLNNKEYVDNMSKWFKAYALWRKQKIMNGENFIHLSPFNGFEESVSGFLKSTQILNKELIVEVSNQDGQEVEKGKGYGCWSGKCDTTFHTIDSGGYKSGCTALTSEIDNKNSKVVAVKWFKKGVNEISLTSTREKRQEDCQTCEFLSICSSGCLSIEKFDGSGECSGGKGVFKTTADLIKNGFINMST